jgi:hypothetical protein
VIAASYSSCCTGNLGLCNAPDPNNNGVGINNVAALCKGLGYSSGTYLRSSTGNSCPQSHVTDANGLMWTSDWSTSPAGTGLQYRCSGFDGQRTRLLGRFTDR